MTKTILLADDSLTIQKVVELTFADTQYHVVSLSSGDELLDKLEEIQPELVICDIIMPERDGYDVCQQIKSNPSTLHIPVILLSGTFEPFDRDRALAAGCSEIITKPFEAKRLVDAVEKLLSSAPTGDDEELESFGFGDASQDAEALETEVDFGTQLAGSGQFDSQDDPGGPESDQSIDFTTSGFAEMEAAGQAASGLDVERIPDGIDYSEGNDSGGSADSGIDDDLAITVDEDFADAFSMRSTGNETTAPVIGGNGADPFAEGDESGFGGSSASDPAGPFADDLGASDEDLFEGAEFASDADMVDRDGEPDFEVVSAEEAFATDPGPVVITDADTAPLPSPPDEGEGLALADADRELELPTIEPTPNAGAGLSDDDVERIARRVVELAADRIEQIAWEVIPDVAEVVVRERVRQLEAEFETEN